MGQISQVASPKKIKQDKIHREVFTLTQHIQVGNEFRKPSTGPHIPPGERGEPVLRASEEDRTFEIKPRETPKQTEL